ncbi:MAG TPA: DNA-3-methyladenine glycosylase [Blastocatellia bacterium]|nr:DNA-3-methyladenine glycosylase [Blastocatellia bacterium]
MARLQRDFFEKPTLRVARDLLGKFIVRRYRTRLIAGMIIDTEAYKGPRDRASHAFNGRRTPRVEVLYGDPGLIYIHFVYGMHWLLNLTTGPKGLPEGVLIRGLAIRADSKVERVLGPARVTKYLNARRSLYGEDAVRSARIWVEDRGIAVAAGDSNRGRRVGIEYAGPYWASRLWRFQIKAHRLERYEQKLAEYGQRGISSELGI